MFFPLEQPVEARAGDSVHVTIRISNKEVIYQWQVEVNRQQDAQSDTFTQIAKYEQGGLKGIPSKDFWMERFLSTE